MVEIKARGAAKTWFTNVNEHFAATNNAEFGLFQQNLVSEDVVELILDMKRSNWSWGALRISQELLLLGIHVHKKIVKRMLLENGMYYKNP
jgi:hypothetical protein